MVYPWKLTINEQSLRSLEESASFRRYGNLYKPGGFPTIESLWNQTARPDSESQISQLPILLTFTCRFVPLSHSSILDTPSLRRYNFVFSLPCYSRRFLLAYIHGLSTFYLNRKVSSIHALLPVIGRAIPSMPCYSLLSYYPGPGSLPCEECVQHSLPL